TMANAVNFGSAGGNLGNPFANMALPQVLEVLSYRIDPAKAGDNRLQLALRLTGDDDTRLVTLAHSVLVYEPMPEGIDIATQVQVSRPGLAALLAGKRTAADLIAAGEMTATGDADALARLGSYLTMAPGDFPIVTP
ncbi:MAG: hypothetical protein KDE55_09410, partial [Novosphingobium sp.]|nr:hypothetical protein [Novosphingobium sp.]